MAKRRRLNRERVIAKAVEMADEAGDPSAISLTALAEALNVQPPSLYNHVAGLADLQVTLAIAGLRLLLADLRQAAAGLTGRDAITHMADAYRRFAHEHPGIYPLIIRAPSPDESALSALSQEMIQMLLLVMASLGLHGDEAIHAIRGLRATLHGFVSLEAAEGYKLPQDPDESFRRLVAAYLEGVLGTPRQG
jgi:AcrR family transcriptional regulator